MGSAPDISPLIVLVHGAWHGAWCWAPLQAELDRRGIASIAIDLPGHGASSAPLTGLHGDAAAVSASLDELHRRSDAPVVLVGHSYGGAVITHAAAGRNDIAELVYVAAFALDDGESVLGALGAMEPRDIALSAAMVPSEDGTSTTLDPAVAAGALYNECPDAAIAAALARLSPQPMATMTEAVIGDPRSTISSTYVVCAKDRSVHPDHQATMASRCSARIDLDTDHSPFVSAVGELADALQTAAGVA